jgi:hypothetical protein
MLQSFNELTVALEYLENCLFLLGLPVNSFFELFLEPTASRLLLHLSAHHAGVLVGNRLK